MKVFLIAAVTKDGFIAKSADDKSFDWTSLEDKKFYVSKIKQAQAIVMGRKSFETFSKYPKNSNWLIYTSEPQKFINPSPKIIKAKGVNQSAKNLLKKLAKNNYQQVAICGGQSIYSLFLETGLVDELYLTVEQAVKFSSGIKLFKDKINFDIKKLGQENIKILNFSYKLVEQKQLADNTKLLVYCLLQKHNN